MRILVVDDFKPWRNFASKVLQGKPECQVVCEAADGLEAVQQARQLQPDLILLDIGLPAINGVEAARRIREVSPASKILFLSENRSLDIVEQALNTGAGGYVLKSDAAKELLRAVEAVLHGKVFVSSSLTGRGSINSQDEHSAKEDRCERVVVPSGPQRDANSRHELRLYSDDAAFVRDLAHSIEAALENGNAVVVVATESHRANLLQQLNADGVDTGDVSERKLYIPLDVSDSLSTVMDTSTDANETSTLARRIDNPRGVVR
jgi:DNA-binding NarL/FixJ family response regulator